MSLRSVAASLYLCPLTLIISEKYFTIYCSSAWIQCDHRNCTSLFSKNFLRALFEFSRKIEQNICLSMGKFFNTFGILKSMRSIFFDVNGRIMIMIECRCCLDATISCGACRLVRYSEQNFSKLRVGSVLFMHYLSSQSSWYKARIFSLSWFRQKQRKPRRSGLYKTSFFTLNLPKSPGSTSMFLWRMLAMLYTRLFWLYLLICVC